METWSTTSISHPAAPEPRRPSDDVPILRTDEPNQPADRPPAQQIFAEASSPKVLPNSAPHATTVGVGDHGRVPVFAEAAIPGRPHAEGIRSRPAECYSQPPGGRKKNRRRDR